MADYIKLEHVTTYRSLFVISRPPHRPFKDAQVLNDILGKAYDKDEVEAAGALCWRPHPSPQPGDNLVQNGASLEEINDTLRHRFRTTTMLYARLDVEGLRSIARPWPTAGDAA